MGETFKPAALVNAFLLGDLVECERELALADPEEPVYEAAAALLTAGRALRDQDGFREPLEQLMPVLGSPPEDTELFRALLMAAARLLIVVGRVSEAVRHLRLARQLTGRKDSAAARAFLLECESFAAFALLQIGKAYELGAEACAQDVPRGSWLWYKLRINYAKLAMNQVEFGVAEEVLADLVSDPPEDAALSEMLTAARVRLMTVQGRAREGLELIEGAGASVKGWRRRNLLAFRVRLLLSLCRFEEAEALLESRKADLHGYLQELLKARMCLFRGDLEGVRRHARAGIAGGGNHPVVMGDFAMILAATELSAGNAPAARSLLRLNDPNEEELEHAFFWAYLCLLEGKDQEAGRQLHRVLRRGGPIWLRECLRYAPSLSGAQVAYLWTLADELPDDEASAVEGRSPEGGAHPALVGECPQIGEVRSRVERFAPLTETVLISGETGTGKEVVARLLHDSSPRAAEPFIAINCAAITEALIESELFGHVRGAFTGAERSHRGVFEDAGTGTVFLDEIAEMSPRLQAALLRVLESGEIRPVGASRSRRVAARVLAASNKPLEELVERGEFRSDLYYRLARLHVHLPPLRERPGDLPLLVRHFLQRFVDYGQVAIGEDLMRALGEYSWPGNVRELRNELERLVIFASGERVLHAGHFARLRQGAPSAEAAPDPVPAVAAPAPDRLSQLRELFTEHRELTRAQVTELLGWSPNTSTKYLRMLEDEGHVRRVMTSAAVRTSYFELTAPEPDEPEDEAAQARPGRVPGGDPERLKDLRKVSRYASKRRDAIRKLFAEHGRLMRAELMRILEVSSATATKDLRALVAEGLIEKVEPNRSPRSHYFRLRSS